MDPISGLIGGAANVLGGIFGGLFSSGDRDKALSALKQAYDQINQVGAPPDLAKQIIYDQFNQVGLYTPELAHAVEQNYSQLASLQEDPGLRQAEMGALNKMRGISDVGITGTERAAMNNVREQANRDDAGRRGAIMQNMQARGQAGSGAELAAQLSGEQAAANNEASQSDRVAAEANQRALQALSQYGEMSNQVRNQDFNVNSTKAKAADELNRFNVVAQQNAQNTNVANQNQAAQQNLAQKQNISNMNTSMSNAEKLRQREAENQNYYNKLTYANAKANALKGEADVYNKTAQNTSNTIGGIGKTVGDIGSSMYQYFNQPSTPGGTTMSTQPATTGGNGSDSSLSPDELRRRQQMRGF